MLFFLFGELAVARASGEASLHLVSEDDSITLVDEWKEIRMKPSVSYIGLDIAEQ